MMGRDLQAKLLAAGIGAGFLLALAYHHGLMPLLGRDYYPFNTFLYNPAHRFSDYYHISAPTHELNPYRSGLCVYFPATFLIVYPLTFLRDNAALFLVLIAVLATWGRFTWKRLAFLPRDKRAIVTALLTLLPYPILAAVDRGNVELILFIFLIRFFEALLSERWKSAAIFLALASSMKLYPAAYALLLLRSSRWKETALAAGLTLLFTLVSAAILEGGVVATFQGLARNLDGFYEGYVIGIGGAHHNSTLFGLAKVALYELFPTAKDAITQAIPALASASSVATAVLLAALSVFVLRRKTELWEAAALISAAIIALTHVSFDYKLLHLLYPALLLVSAPKSGRNPAIPILLFVLLLIPKNYGILRGDTSFAVIMNPVLLIFLAVFLIHNRASKAESATKDHPLDISVRAGV